MPSKGTDRKSFRVESEIWNEFGSVAIHHKDGRSGVLRDFIRWFLDKPGAALPVRAADAVAAKGTKSGTDQEPASE